MDSPLTILKSKCGVNNIIFSSMLGISEADLHAMEQGRKAISADVLTALRKIGFLRDRDIEKFNADQNEYLRSKIALSAYAGVNGKHVSKLTEAERTQALIEDQAVNSYQDNQYIVRYVRQSDDSYY